MSMPRYPIYIPSKGRADACLTARCLDADGVNFRLVVEPQEISAYAERFGAERVLVLPFRDRGSVIPARNWIKDHSISEGYERHWQLDDNIKGFRRAYRKKRISCDANVALMICEDFADRYENVAIAGLNYTFFVYPKGNQNRSTPPFYLNAHIYSCMLMFNAIPHRWRGRYNEDTDICLQVLADGWCTILINAFMIDKMETMTMRGGNTDALYHGDGRLTMARSLERAWPGVVKTVRLWRRPQHSVDWTKFDTPLKRKLSAVVSDAPNEYGMRLVKIGEKVRSAELRQMIAEQPQERT